MQRPLLADIFENFGVFADDESKVTHLQKNDSPALRQLLGAAFNPEFKFQVEIPPYKPTTDAEGFATNNLLIEYKRLYVFLESSKATPQRRKEILWQMLESIDARDAKLLVNVLQKNLSEYGLTPEIVNKAFPGTIPPVSVALVSSKKKK